MSEPTQNKYLTEEEIYAVIPRSFTIAASKVEVIVKPYLKDGEQYYYGRWKDASQVIEIAQQVKECDEFVSVNMTQIRNTFYHELFHCFCFFSAFEQDESLVQTFANWMIEYENTKQFTDN